MVKRIIPSPATHCLEEVEEYYQTLKEKGVAIVIDLRKEVWGDHHFSIVDPNGVGIDIVTYTAPVEE